MSSQSSAFPTLAEHETPAGCDYHPSMMGPLSSLQLHSLKQCAAVASSPWNLITCSVAFFLCLFDMTSQEDSADEAVLSPALTEIRCPRFIKETLTDLMGAGSRNADKDVTLKDSMGQGESSVLS